MSTCPYIFKNNSSKNKGSVCGRSIRGGSPFCWQHKASGLKQMKEEPKKTKKVKEVIMEINTESESFSDIQEPEIEEIKVNKSKTTPYTQLKNTPAPKKKKYSSSSSSSSESSYSLDSSLESTEESYSLSN